MTPDNLTLFLAQDAAPDRPVAPDNSAPTATTESQDASQTPLVDGDNADAGPPSSNFNMLILLVPLALVFFMMSMSGRKEKKKRATMMAAMAKGDKIQSIGGILGTIVELRDDEIIVKVDENANTRLRFARSAIQSIVESKKAE